jgi:hypothetical protein
MKHRLLVLIVGALALSSCSSYDPVRAVCTDYSLEVVEESSPPLIDRNHPGSAGNKQGYEGGMKDWPWPIAWRDSGEGIVIPTPNTPEGFDCVARIKVRLVKKQISPERES